MHKILRIFAFFMYHGFTMEKGTASKRIIAIDVLKVLEEQADIDKPLNATQIGEKIKARFGYTVSRATVENNLKKLKEHGYNIVCDTHTRNGKEYRLNWALKDTLTEQDLHLIVDCIARVKVLPIPQRLFVIDKLRYAYKGKDKVFDAVIKTIKQEPQRNKKIGDQLKTVRDAIKHKQNIEINRTEFLPYPRIHEWRQPKSWKGIATRTQRSQCVVTPYKLYNTEGGWMLVCRAYGETDIGLVKIVATDKIYLLSDKRDALTKEESDRFTTSITEIKAVLGHGQNSQNIDFTTITSPQSIEEV